MDRAAAFFDRWLLLLVVTVGAVGLAWSRPSRAVVGHHGINLALVVLVAAVGLGLPTTALADARTDWRRIATAVVVGAAVLPVLAWLASHLAPAGPLRLGVLAAGVAPSEVAAVALAALAGGRAALSAAVLIGATVLSVATAGPVLHLEAGSGHSFSATNLLLSLVRIVIVPLVVSTIVRARLPARLHSSADQVSAVVSSVVVLVLIWLVAGQATVSVAYLRAGAALLLFLVGSTAVGAVVTVRLPRSRRISLLLPVAMRDFAIAAGIASAAFGAKAAAALGIYGVLVLLLGATAARFAPPDP